MTMSGFWRNMASDNRRPILQGWGQVNRVHYLFPQGDGLLTSFSEINVYSTFAALAPQLKSRDVIVLGGVLREQAVAPDGVFDVLITGAAGSPRQATSGGTPTTGGATWMPPASGAVATTPLLELVRQGWIIENIEFTPHTSSAGIRLTRSASVDLIDAGHCIIRGCLFGANGGSGQIGIEDNGGCGFCLIEENRFHGLTGTAIKGLSTGAAVPLLWRITKNRFNANTNAIGMSLTEALIDYNFIRQTANDTNFKINVVAVSGQGSLNQVIKNIFPDAAANVTIAKGYKPGTTDVWRNWVTDATDEVVTVPA